ncbi:MAG: hypothetical protein JWP19_830 [Rhodoglobus sp.]|nr:hypothetical protein [Rhodoglobus sp.]
MCHCCVMSHAPVFFGRPEGPSSELKIRPELASWNASKHPDQQKLLKSLNYIESVLTRHLTDSGEQLALRLDVGLGADTNWLRERDLDNYLYPLAKHLTKGRKLALESVWATKAVGASSTIRCEPAHRTGTEKFTRWASVHEIHTTASSQREAYKQQISDQLGNVQVLPDGPLVLELAFVVGQRRNWLNLWKPSIDALDKLLGRTNPERRWHPRDGRIIELGLHRNIDPTLRNEVMITVAAHSLV